MGMNDFSQGSIKKRIIEQAIPLTLAQVVQLLYNMVDRIYIGHLPEIGDMALTGVGITFPIIVLIAAFTGLFGNGAVPLFSITRGNQQENEAECIMGNAFTLLVTASVVLFVVCYVFRKPILFLFGASEASYEYADQYLQIYLFGTMCAMLTTGMNGFINAQGFPRIGMLTTVVGAVINIILDPIFIFGLHMGVRGAALATVIGQAATALLAVWYLMNMKIIKPAKADYALNGQVCGRTLILGITSFLSQISLVAAMAAINNMLRKYGALDAIFGQEQYAQIPMAVVGIVMKFFQIVISIVVGMAAGCIPIVGFNMGAGKKLRVKELFTKLLIAEAAVGAVALILVEFFPQQLINIFGAANESVYYTEFAIKAFRIYLCMMIFACVNKACFIFLQAMGKAAASTALSMIREVVFGVGFAIILPLFFGLDGVIYSMPVSDILTFVIAVFLIRRTYQELKEEQ